MTFLQTLDPDPHEPPTPGDAWAIVTAAATPCPHGNPGTVADNPCCRHLQALLIRHDWHGFHHQHAHDSENR